MPKQDQLEIITPDGVIEFYPLDRSKGIVSIGRHPDNDVVIDSPNVALFHALVDYSRKPCHVTLLSQDGKTTLGGQTLSPNVPTVARLQVWLRFRLNDPWHRHCPPLKPPLT
jgi:hypothetical protein